LGSIILEPVGRNTAPAIALAALLIEDDPLLLVLAADHVVQDQIAFTRAVILVRMILFALRMFMGALQSKLN